MDALLKPLDSEMYNFIIAISSVVISTVLLKIYLKRKDFKYSWIFWLWSLCIFLIAINRLTDYYRLRVLNNIIIVSISILAPVLSVAMIFIYNNLEILTRSEYRRLINDLQRQIRREEDLVRELRDINIGLKMEIENLERIRNVKEWVAEYNRTLENLKALFRE